VGDSIVGHLLDEHHNEFLTYWFLSLSLGAKDEILSKMYEYER